MQNLTDDDLLYMELILSGKPPETSEEVDAVLRSEGYDPQEVAEWGRRIAQEAIGWAKKAQDKQEIT